jgi:iron complex outermembrane receptor protein
MRVTTVVVAAVGPLVAPVAVLAAAADDVELQEVVVTAEKRSESLVNVPISVTAISADKLDKSGVTSVKDLDTVVPGLHMDSAGEFFQPTIRGVGTSVVTAGFSSNVATYVDGIYQPDMAFSNFDFIDVDSVQVLKGPQGTLFGRNATGGAILVTTRSPSFAPKLELRGGYGSFNTATYDAFGSAGLIDDKLAVSVAAGGRRSDGWLTNLATGAKANPSNNWTTRLKFLFTPIADLKFTLSLHAAQVNDPSAWMGGVYHGWSDAALFGVPVAVGSSRLISLAPGSYYNFQKGGGADLKTEYDFGFAKLTSYTAYFAIKQREVTSESYGPFIPNGTAPLPGIGIVSAVNYVRLPGYDHAFSQEFDLGGSTGKGALDWLAGLYYFWDKQTYSPVSVSLYGPFGPGGVLTGGTYPFPASSYVNTDSEAFTCAGIAYTTAIFSDATYNWGQWHFTGGLRLSKDRAGAEYQSPATLGSGFVAVPFTSLSHDFYSATPRVVARYSLTDNSNVYASWSRGNKAGAYDTSAIPADPTPVKPERIDDFELGYKLAQRDWQLETAAFYYDYRDLQVASYNSLGTILQNAPAAKIFGGEFHVQGRIYQELHLELGAAYTHSRYTDFRAATIQTWSPVFGVQNATVDVSGQRMERTPNLMGSATLDYAARLLGGLLGLSTTYAYQTATSFDFANTIGQGGYGTLNLRAGWTDPSAHWSVSVTGKNVTDAKYLTYVLPRTSGAFGAVYGEPLNVMLEIAYKY